MENKFNDLPYLQIIQNHTIYQFADEAGIDYDELIKIPGGIQYYRQRPFFLMKDLKIGLK
ncbi:MAG: hypothetical protein IPN29_15920 [Saprospiraceae bacterium]|nr:hypothetical protein [Saprospiraceae bacterium]